MYQVNNPPEVIMVQAKEFSVKYAVALGAVKTAHSVATSRKGYAHEYVIEVESGAKYDKLVEKSQLVKVLEDGTLEPVGGFGPGGSAHAFVVRATGDLVKAASWKAPQKSKTHPSGLAVRYNVATEEGFAAAVANCTSYGYLYAN
jgi:hypothetical protein